MGRGGERIGGRQCTSLYLAKISKKIIERRKKTLRELSVIIVVVAIVVQVSLLSATIALVSTKTDGLKKTTVSGNSHNDSAHIFHDNTQKQSYKNPEHGHVWSAGGGR